MKNLQERVNEIMSVLPKSVIELGANTEYLMPYLQHLKEEVDEAQYNFLMLCSDVLRTDVYKVLNKSDYVNRHGIIGRYLDDSGNHILYEAWSRFMCIDIEFREWCQPYYAINYKNYKIEECVCINDKYPEIISHFRDRKINELLK